MGDIVLARHDIVGLLEIARVDLVVIDELDEIDRALAFEFDGVELVIIERDVLVLLDLIALDDVCGINLANAGATFW